MITRVAALLAVALLAASCSSGESGESSNTLLTSTVPTTTLPPTTLAPTSPGTIATTTTTVPATSTTTTTRPATTTTTTAPPTTTTTVPATDVAGSEDGSNLDTLEELPLTGPEPEVTLVALIALLVGVWLLRWSGMWNIRLARLQSRRWRRPDAPSAEARPPWPPNAMVPRSDADRRFRAVARHLADSYGVSFLDGVDAYATDIARSSAAANDDEPDDAHGRWRRAVLAEVRSIYRLD